MSQTPVTGSSPTVTTPVGTRPQTPGHTCEDLGPWEDR